MIEECNMLLLVSCYDENRCDKTSWYSLFTFTACTLIAQVVLTLRLRTVLLPRLSPKDFIIGYTP